MIENGINRRDFLKVLGWGGATITLSGCGFTSVEDGRETVVSYVEPSEYALPGIGVYFNSTCAQCDAGCGISGRVREGRVLKLEGNAASAINRGKTCGLGQAGVQAHYNPDRVRTPLLRKGGQGESISWENAYKLIAEKLTGVKGDEVAFMTGAMSGHVKVLLKNYLDDLGSKSHYVYDAVAPAVVRASNKKAYGVEMPRLRLDKAKVVVSFGADFLGSWISPVHFSQQYAQFRKASRPEGRGVLVQIEPKMTLTGANADRWLVIRPGTEGVLALGIIHALGKAGLSVPSDAAAAAKAYSAERVSQETGVSVEHIEKLATLLKTRTPSLVLAGDAAEGYAHGSQNAAAIALLNRVLGNVGKTIVAPAKVPFPQIDVSTGGRSAVQALNEQLSKDKVKVLFVQGANPVYSAPAALGFADNLKKAAFKVVLTNYMDETALAADLVLPLDSALEGWGTSVSEYQADGVQLNIQQPLMERLHADTQGLGDVLLALLKQRRPNVYGSHEDFYSYLRNSVVAIKGALGGAGKDEDLFWSETLSQGVIKLPTTAGGLSSRAGASISLPAAAAEDAAFPLRLIPAITANMRDGRHANQPWLQESPDPLTTIVWDSWMEIHPKTAEKLGIADGDIVEIASKSGTIKTQAYLFPGIHPEAVSVPVGYGHQALGRYAKGVGANVAAILDPVTDKETGELAFNETRVKVGKTGKRVIVVKDEGFAGGKQMGKKIALRKASDKVDLSEEV